MLWLREGAEVVEDLPAGAVRGTTLDPDDDYLAGLVLFGGVPYLVTGDRHLLDLGGIGGSRGSPMIHVLTPRVFLEELERSE